GAGKADDGGVGGAGCARARRRRRVRPVRPRPPTRRISAGPAPFSLRMAHRCRGARGVVEAGRPAIGDSGALTAGPAFRQKAPALPRTFSASRAERTNMNRIAALAFGLAVAFAARADEGMWTYDN